MREGRETLGLHPQTWNRNSLSIFTFKTGNKLLSDNIDSTVE